MTFDGRFGLFVGATFLMCLSPGPLVMLSLSLGLRDGFASVWRASLGAAASSLLFLLATVLGLLALLRASESVFAALRIAGAAWLVYIGIRALLAGFRDQTAAGIAVASRGAPLAQGFLTHVTNPKSLLYWSALLPPFVDPSQPATPQVAWLGAVAIFMDVAVLAGYGALAASTRNTVLNAGFRRWLDRVASVFFVATGMWLGLDVLDSTL